ncbi:MAG: hypothetical protein E6559_00025 [Pantoea sp.]|uniref:hypothetical protein n=1 Tax=Erwiniaceae TaxID=1903409 RepID=UPI00289C6BDA|nr:MULTISPECIES: hypothetical protein [Pantoea]MDU5837899.1 hypothetical protein [Pantoea sp.]MDU6438295.1 hypothetical protein [Pantoea sp.]
MNDKIFIGNEGQAINQTNYWDTEHAAAGLVFLSWNAGAARLLVPDAAKALLPEMKGAQYVIISRGKYADRDALEILFEDGSDAPFCIHLMAEQSDRMLPESDQGGGFVVTVWTRGGQKHRYNGKYRVVESLPCLDPWSEQ